MRKKRIGSDKASNIVVIATAVLVIGYLIVSFILLGQKTAQLNKKMASKEFLAKNIEKMCIDKYCFDIEIAKTPEQRKQWLMFRKSLSETSGMLFVFPSADYHNFWMKNTLIPLDIIWLDHDFNIIYIEKNTQPCGEELSKANRCLSYWPEKKASFVLEILGGLSDKFGTGGIFEIK